MLHELRDQVLMVSCAVAHGRTEACMLPADRPEAHPGPPRPDKQPIKHEGQSADGKMSSYVHLALEE